MRTRSGGNLPWSKTQRETMLAFQTDLLGDHRVIGDGEVIDASNRHFIIRMIQDLKNKL